MPRPLVLFSPGAVLLRDVVMGLSWCDSVMFVCDEGQGSAALPLLEDVGDVIVHRDFPETLARVVEFAPDGIVTFVEHLLPLAAQLAHALRLPYNSPEVVNALRDKSIQRRLLRSGGPEDVPFSTVRSAQECRAAVRESGFPVVLKPIRGAGSADTYLVDSEARLRAVLSRVQPREGSEFQVERFLVAKDNGPFAGYVSVESLIADGTVHHLGITGKLPQLPPFRETGQFFPAVISADEAHAVLDLTTRSLARLGVTQGQAHTEVILTDDGPRVVEVNGRLGGYINELYSRVYSMDVIELCVRMACGADVELPAEPVAGVHFQYYHQPPLGGEQLNDVDGGRRVARSPGIVRYDRLVTPGSFLPQHSGSFDLDLVAGWSPRHDVFLEQLQQAQGQLMFTFGVDGGHVTLSGRELAGGAAVPGRATERTSAPVTRSDAW